MNTNGSKLTQSAASNTATQRQSAKQPVVDIARACSQPKSIEEERRLQEKYGNMDLEERAFNILVDFGMVDLHSDPEDVTLGLEDDE